MSNRKPPLPPTPTTRPFDFEAMARRLGLRHGFIDDDRRAATPFVVDCDGLTRSNLTEDDEFGREFSRRRLWCEQHAAGEFEIEVIGPNRRMQSGYRFRFADEKTAAVFKLSFPVDLWSSDSDRGPEIY